MDDDGVGAGGRARGVARFLKRGERLLRRAGIGVIAGRRDMELSGGCVERERGVLRTWEHLVRYGDNGWLGCAVVVDPARLVDTRELDGNVLAVGRSAAGETATVTAPPTASSATSAGRNDRSDRPNTKR